MLVYFFTENRFCTLQVLLMGFLFLFFKLITYTIYDMYLLTFGDELVFGIRDFVSYNLSRAIMLSCE